MKKLRSVLEKRTGPGSLPGKVKKAVKAFDSVRRNRKRIAALAKGICKISRDSRKRRFYG